MKNKGRRLLSYLLVFSMILGMCTPVFGAENAEAEEVIVQNEETADLGENPDGAITADADSEPDEGNISEENPADSDVEEADTQEAADASDPEKDGTENQTEENVPDSEISAENRTEDTEENQESLVCNYIFTQSDDEHQSVLIELGENTETVLESAVLSYQDGSGEIQTAQAEEVVENVAAFLLDIPAEGTERAFLSVAAVAGGQEYVTEIREEKDMAQVEMSSDEVTEAAAEVTEAETGLDSATAEQVEECVITADDAGISSQDIENAVSEANVLEEQAGSGAETFSVKGKAAQTAAVLSAVPEKKKQYIVVLDPGHGTIDTNGYDPGAGHTFSDGTKFVEADITMKIAKYVKEELSQYPEITVYMTHDTVGASKAIKMTLGERVEYAANKHADLLVSLHLNSFSSESAHGAEVLVPKTGRYNNAVAENAEKAANNILKRLTSLGLTDRGLKTQDSSDTKYPDGSKADYYAIIRGGMQNSIPAIIVEHAFLSGTADKKYLKTDAAIKNLAKADAYGIAQYFGVETGGEIYEEVPEADGEWRQMNGKWYYYLKGTKQTGWQKIDGKFYYLNSAGVMQTGWQKVGGSWYYLNSKGVMLAGLQTIGGKKYYLNASGAMQTGWQTISKKRYYFQSSGAMLGAGWNKLGSTWYYMDANGAVKTGWVKVSGKWYYMDSKGCMKTGWQKIDGKRYYLQSSGAMLEAGWHKLGKYWYYMASDGAAKTGWITVGGQKYYMDSQGRMKTGWQKVSGKNYYFNGSGAMQKGWLKLSNKWYYLNGKGVMAEGWTHVGSKWYYLTPEKGVMKTGWFKVSGVWYYCNGSGAMLKGWQKLGGKWYYLKSTGTMAEGWTKVSGKWYYLKPGNGAMQTGWIKISGKWYYCNASGARQTGWLQLGSKWYYLNKNGVMYTGWHTISGKDYYFNSSGAWVKGKKKPVASSTADKTNTDGLYAIEGKSSVTAEQMAKYYDNSGCKYPASALKKGGAADIETFAEIVLEEANAEGIKAEVVFAQAMKETGWLQFGGDVSVKQFNFAGLGATGNGAKGNSFKDVRTGIRAQVQHLKAYSSDKELKNTCVDERFTYVTRKSAPYVEWLGIPDNPKGLGWAAAKDYGKDLVNMIKNMKKL